MRAALLAIAFASPLSIQARTLDFHSEIRIAKSGELTVTERIMVEARGRTPGLERELPPESRVIDVMRNGNPEHYVLEEARLRTDAPPFAGRHLYQVTYRSRRVVSFQDAHDELRWSVKGAERLTAEVILPAPVPARAIKAEAAGREWQTFVRDGRAAFRARDAITLRVRFPKEVVAPPEVGERARWLVADYVGLLLVAAGLALAAAMLVYLKKISSRT